MKVLFAAAELAPLVKVGGLADVTGSLPLALGRRGLDVRAILPLYRRFVPSEGTTGLGRSVRALGRECPVWRTDRPGFPVYLLQADDLYDRPGVYGEGGQGYADNDRRYGLLAAVALELGEAIGWEPDVLHLHDWHTAAATVHARRRGGPPTLLTIHNLAYQGVFPRESLPALGLGEELLVPEVLEHHGQVNLLKGGILSADRVGTVSPTYAREICTPAFGEGLDGVLRALPEPPLGILNGLDLKRWDPAADSAVAPIRAADPLSGKAANKERLCRELGLKSGPVLAGMVTRLAQQKGVDLVLQALPQLLDAGVSVALLGEGDPALAAAWEAAARDHPGRVAFSRTFDDALARRIYAGSDLFLVPSRFEPCGLTQMIALRYGSVPVVRRTGGLGDTVREGEDGFVFEDPDPDQLAEAVGRAVGALAREDRRRILLQRGMARDFSWDASAGRYHEVYEGLVRCAPQGGGGER